MTARRLRTALVIGGALVVSVPAIAFGVISAQSGEPGAHAAPSRQTPEPAAPRATAGPATQSPEPGASPSAPADPGDPGPAPRRDPAEPFEPVTGPLEDDGAAALVEAALDVPDAEKAPDEERLGAEFADIAAGSYLAELESTWLELEANGWSYTGAPRVDGLEILSLDEKATPATAELRACIDSTDVALVDADGERIGAAADAQPRAAHLFSLVREDDTWRVAARTFPDDPTC